MKHKKLSPAELKKKFEPSGEKKKKDFHLKCTNKIFSLKIPTPHHISNGPSLKWIKISRALCSTKSAKYNVKKRSRGSMRITPRVAFFKICKWR